MPVRAGIVVRAGAVVAARAGALVVDGGAPIAVVQQRLLHLPHVRLGADAELEVLFGDRVPVLKEREISLVVQQSRGKKHPPCRPS